MIPRARTAILLAAAIVAATGPAAALDRPWIGDVFFYWYTWDYDRELGSWIGGIHNTPLAGYYDSRTLRDNRRSLWQASEWGLTHHFMDYWAPDWKGEGNRMREAVVMEAAESLRKEGYDIWMAYYQDGQNFEMAEFSKNVSEKRDVYQWLRDFARSPVWPKLDGRPLQLVYSRNGSPKTTVDHAGFRAFLRQRYGDVAALNRAWKSAYGGFDEIEMSFSGRGPLRAASIDYQYRLWQREWEKLDSLVQREFHLPGMRASFDVGYGPYMHFGYGEFARVFGGPHSYAGIFGPPHDEDAQRFLQATIARKYHTVFLDHFKNYYFDWDIRVPGMAYLPDPFHFDRFWVGALARRSEALLHLSWNEWWEGSNLEPCREFGKTYCEKNLLYATLLKRAFDSIHQTEQTAQVALLVNDWRLASAAGHEDELYQTVQTLRRLCVPFDVLPDGLVTTERLAPFRLVIAPTYGCGLGANAAGEPIAEVLRRWLSGGSRRLIVSADPSMAALVGLKETAPPTAASNVRGDDLNVFVDVGAESDDQFLRLGFSQRETWGGKPSTGADPRRTFRWTPAVGDETTFFLPASPNRDHVLRLCGRAIWPNRIDLIVNGRQTASREAPAGEVRLDFAVPAASVGATPMVSLALRYAKSNVPMKEAPAQYPGEARVCNLALEWAQWSTSNVAAETRTPRYTMPEDSIRLTGEVFGRSRGTAISAPVQPRPYLDTSRARVVSALARGDIPRDVLVPVGSSEVLYVNGPLSEVQSEAYWLPLVQQWGKADFARYAAAPQCMVGRLWSGDTEFVVAFNEDIAQARPLRMAIESRGLPLSEAVALTRDGRMFEPLETRPDGDLVRATDTLRYYGAYQFVRSPVRIATPALAFEPGQSREVLVEATNLTDKPVRGTIAAGAVIPTISGRPAAVELGPGEKKTVAVPIAVAATADWGRKTIYFDLDFDGRRAVALRELVVLRPAEPELAETVLDGERPRVAVRAATSPYGKTAPLDGRLSFRGRAYPLAVPEGQQVTLELEGRRPAPGDQPVLQPETLRIEFSPPRATAPIEREVFLAQKPAKYHAVADAVAAIVVFNGRAAPLVRELVSFAPPTGQGPWCVRTDDGKPVAGQVWNLGETLDVPPAGQGASARVAFLADVPPRAGRVYYLCRGSADAATDLRCAAENLGSGKGTLKVENARLSVVLSEAAGGTVTSLRSARTGRDYGHKSLGVDYGTFSRHDPAKPSTNTVEFIHEKKTRQEDAPGRIELLSQGPAAVAARVSWADAKVRVEQVYVFPAAQPYFFLRQKVRPIDLAGAEELVALDARFRPNRLTKSYPNFVGVPSATPQPHFGWRMGTWVPEYATLLAPNHFDESISLVIPRQTGLVGVRQGFWPARRPEAGKCEAAQVEYLANPATGSEADVYVLLHEGHQIVAKRFLSDLRSPPRVEMVELNRPR
ncbi:MAG: hypothetical protein NUV77_03195 [Thermoguttaceae bacterium]|jgi:hypothetical protein|nr:hypothetical protein [Thermoguttaceae bacterium]